MKIIHLGLISAALFSTFSVQAITLYNEENTKLDIYGRAEGLAGNNLTADGSNAGDLTGRLGIYARQSLNDQFSVVARYEGQLYTRKKDYKSSQLSWDTRYSHIGIDSKDFGLLMLGRTRNPMYQWMGLTDRYMNYTSNVYATGVSSRIDSSYQWNRQDGTLQYEYRHDGLDLRAAYVMGDGNEDSTIDKGYMLSMGYNFSVPINDKALQIKPVLAWQKMVRDQQKSKVKNNYIDYVQQGAGISASYNNTYLAVNIGKQIYQRTNRPDEEYRAVDTLAEYKIKKNIFIRGGYSQLVKQDTDAKQRKQWTIEVEYLPVNNLHLSATYIYDQRDSYDSNENLWVAGVRYEF